jgi:hypothetical protein
VEGKPKVRTAPETLVAFGRPKGYRGSYKQWREDGIAPQVVFEILSPGNRDKEMKRKFEFYRRYGVEEYYVYDPDTIELFGWRRVEDRFEPIEPMHDWISPRLGIRFDVSGVELTIYGPDNRRFLTFQELVDQRANEQRRAELAERQASEAQQQARQAQARAERLAAQLRALGIDPDA